MMTRIARLLLLIAILIASPISASAREGDTLEPISINAPTLETFPEGFLADNDFQSIQGRVQEARNAGVPLAVRIVDMSQTRDELPYQVRSYASLDLSQPLSQERQQAVLQSWINAEPVESEPGADDGFLLLVLVPEDRTNTQAIWWIGPNALPLNSLNAESTYATTAVMNEQFAAGNMPNGVFLGVSEFSYNAQFGTPDRLERTVLGEALHKATIPLAIGTLAAGFAIPALAVWLSRRHPDSTKGDIALTPWLAAALKYGRATPNITAAMLLDAVHNGTLTPLADGGLQITTDSSNTAVEALCPFANDDGRVPQIAMYDVTAITHPVRISLEDELAASGAMITSARTDRMWMLIAMGLAAFVALLAIVPTVISMSDLGVLGIVINVICIVIGWWWIKHRNYTTAYGRDLLSAWLESASEGDRLRYDTAAELDLLTDQAGGPDSTMQTKLVRQLRGLSAG